MKVDAETQKRLAAQAAEYDRKLASIRRAADEVLAELEASAKRHQEAVEWGLVTFPAVQAVK